MSWWDAMDNYIQDQWKIVSGEVDRVKQERKRRLALIGLGVALVYLWG